MMRVRVVANRETSNDGNATVSRAVVGTPPPRPLPQETDGTPAPRLLLARLADADGTPVGVARHNDLVAHEDQLLVAVEAGRVVRGGSVPVGLAGWGGHLYARSGGVRLPPVARDASGSKGLCDGVRGLQEARDDTAAALCKGH